MAKQEHRDTLEISEDMDFQRASWKFQRIGWVVMVLLVLAALAGVFGGGPLSSSELGDSRNGVKISYDRFIRAYAPQTIDLEITSAAIQPDSMVSVWLGRSWLESTEVRSIVPEPEKTELGTDRIVYSFRVAPSSVPLRVRFELEVRALGGITGHVGLVNGSAQTFEQFAYP